MDWKWKMRKKKKAYPVTYIMALFSETENTRTELSLEEEIMSWKV